MRRSLKVLLFLFLAPAAGLPLALAQGTTATLKGRLVDTGGSGLPSVVVVIQSKSQPSANKSVVSDIEGNYRIPLLPPANDYYLKIDYPGFAPIELGPLDLDPGKTTVADVTLRSDAEMVDVVKVEARGNIVDVSSTKTASVYNAEFIEGLPIIGHNFQDVLVLAPGVTDTDGDGNPNVHGARDTGLQIRLDGGNITDPVSGTFGQNLNQDIIEELEVITSGASAEFGRADGGFANIITKSGGNEFDGKFSMFWQGRFLNGDGANNNDTNKFDNRFPSFRDIRPSLSLGGAILKDRLWYFGSLQILDTELPVNQVGANILITSRGHSGFGKLTWQVNSYNKLALQISSDPRDFLGLGLQLGVSPDSDFLFEQGGITPQLRWTSTISPQLLLETNITHFDSGIAVSSVSPHYREIDVEHEVIGNTVQARYPCETINCNPSRGERVIFQQDLITGGINGPFNVRTDDARQRDSLKTDLSYNIEDAWGQHSIKAGLEFADETFTDLVVTNPLLVDVTTPFADQQNEGSGGSGITDRITGLQQLQTFEPLRTPQRANSFNSGAFLLDAWKPLPNLTINAGVRLDREDIDTSGFTFFDPRAERRQALSLWTAFCAEARLQLQNGLSANSNCHDPETYNGLPPTGVGDNAVRSFRDSNADGVNDVDPRVASLDLDGDGFISTSGQAVGTEGIEFSRDFTRFEERQTENFSIVNNNLSPRLSVSWDPWADGKTKVFGTFSRFYDRLFLATISGEIGPDNVNYIFIPDQTTNVIIPGSGSRAASTVTINQVDRNLRTPYTDEVSIGFERELAPEWSFGFTYINRKGYDLLQDNDINHLTCAQHTTLGIDPLVVCGDGDRLELDKFGDAATRLSVSSGGFAGGSFLFNPSGGGVNSKNGAPDQYTVNNNFNQVLRVGNFNSSKFETYELRIVKRLHRNWQMQASYAWSEAFGQAEAFAAAVGNDPETRDDEEGYLLFDQRHVVKFQAVARLPREISLGSVVQFASGTPYSITRTVVDLDSTGNTIFRSFFPTEQRNDQRNEGIWTVDGRLEKAFNLGRVQASAFLNVQNLLNSDDLILTEYDLTALDGLGLEGQRNFGRRFELGATFNF
ncbi:MAG TPA: carboxypeptidase regulatory-like domain-containing protein [Candidatus Polarisedimenticolia bacterium]|nr:carboxypeptidase regulatory-like domain-containing protein [Candidatus Polarisedimenticolia bacterium]